MGAMNAEAELPEHARRNRVLWDEYAGSMRGRLRPDAPVYYDGCQLPSGGGIGDRRRRLPLT